MYVNINEINGKNKFCYKKKYKCDIIGFVSNNNKL